MRREKESKFGTLIRMFAGGESFGSRTVVGCAEGEEETLSNGRWRSGQCRAGQFLAILAVSHFRSLGAARRSWRAPMEFGRRRRPLVNRGTTVLDSSLNRKDDEIKINRGLRQSRRCLGIRAPSTGRLDKLGLALL